MEIARAAPSLTAEAQAEARRQAAARTTMLLAVAIGVLTIATVVGYILW